MRPSQVIDLVCIASGMLVMAIERNWEAYFFGGVLILWATFNFQSGRKHEESIASGNTLEQRLPDESAAAPIEAKAMAASAGK